MSTRQHAGANVDRTHRLHVAAVDTRFACDHAAAHDAIFEVGEFLGHFARRELRRFATGQRGDRGLLDLLEAIATLLLSKILYASASGFSATRCQRCFQRSIGGCRRPRPRGLARFGFHFGDGLDRHLHLLVAEHHCAQHHCLGQAVGLRLDHQHRFGGAGDHQVKLRILELRDARVEHVLAVDVADLGGGDRSLERHAGNRQRGRRTDQRRDIGIDFRIDRHHGGDDLDFVEEVLGEQRADWPIDEARGQRLLFGRAAFAFEEPAGNAARGVGLLDVIDGQRKEILVGVGDLAGRRGDQNDGLAHGDHHGAVSLAGQLSGFQRDLMLAEGE